MSIKKVSPENQRRNRKRKQLETEKTAKPRATEAARSPDPELDTPPQRADIDSLRQLRSKILKQEKGYRTQLIESLAEIYRQAQDMQARSMRTWRAFLKEDFFLDKKISSPKKEMKYIYARVCEYGFDANTSTKRKRTCKFSQILKYYDSIGVEPDNLISEIKKAGGLEKAYNLSVEHHKGQRSHKNNIDARVQINPIPTSKDRAAIEVSTELFQINPKLRDRLHDVQKGQEVRIICVFIGNDDQGQAKFKVRQVKRL